MTDQPRVILTGGGTGGHVYPALAVAEAWAAIGGVEILFVGNAAGLEARIVPAAGLAFAAVEAGAIRGRSPVGVAGSLIRLGRGFAQSLDRLRAFRPDAVLATGGYVCVPVAVAARRLGIPFVIYLPDRRPGWAIRFLARFADRIAVTTALAADSLPAAKVVETGYPVRPEIIAADRVAARRALGLAAELPAIVVIGGSRGARSINDAVAANLDAWLTAGQVIQATGEADYPRLADRRAGLPAALQARYYLRPYFTDDLPAALAAADLAVSRSGASVLGEYPVRGLPSILVPYPHAGAHQALNAAVLADAGAAIVLPDAELDRLGPLVLDLIADRDRLAQLAAAARGLARPNAAAAIARLTLTVAGRNRPEVTAQ